MHHKISRTWLKQNTGPAFTLSVYGEEFLTVVASLAWAMVNGPGVISRRHGGYAYQRIVAALPLGAPEITLHRNELMALCDGLDHLARIPYYSSHANRVLEEIRRGAERYKSAHKTKRQRSAVTAGA